MLKRTIVKRRKERNCTGFKNLSQSFVTNSGCIKIKVVVSFRNTLEKYIVKIA